MNIVTTDDGSATRHSERYGETYHSVHGALTEARHIYLNASGVADRLAGKQSTRVLEIGFGLGLNFLLTADLAVMHSTALDYHAIEHDSDGLRLIGDMNYASLLVTPALESALRNYLAGRLNATSPPVRGSTLSSTLDSTLDSSTPDSTPGPMLGPTLIAAPGSAHGNCSPADESNRPNTTAQRALAQHLHEQVALSLHLGDASCITLPTGPFDAVYLDAFSPDSNPECWTDAFLSELHTRMAPRGVLTTYCAKGSVRRSLASAGFFVNKLAGPPGKREIVQAFA